MKDSLKKERLTTNSHEFDELQEFLEDGFMEIADQVSNEKLFLKIQHESLQVGTGSHELHELHEFFKNSFFKVEIISQESLAGDSCGSGIGIKESTRKRKTHHEKKDSPQNERFTKKRKIHHEFSRI